MSRKIVTMPSATTCRYIVLTDSRVVAISTSLCGLSVQSGASLNKCKDLDLNLSVVFFHHRVDLLDERMGTTYLDAHY